MPGEVAEETTQPCPAPGHAHNWYAFAGTLDEGSWVQHHPALVWRSNVRRSVSGCPAMPAALPMTWRMA